MLSTAVIPEELNWQQGPESWWTPPPVTRGMYYRYVPGGSQKELLAYGEGVLYFESAVW